MNQHAIKSDDPRRKVLVELWKVLEWPCVLAIVTFCLVQMFLDYTYDATWAIAATNAAALLGILMLVQSAERFSDAQWNLVSMVTVLVFWLWCIAAGFALARLADAPVFKLLGVVLPPMLCVLYLKPPKQLPHWHNKFSREGSTDEFVTDIARFRKNEPEALRKVLPYLNLAGIRLFTEASRKLNFLIVGAIGSGKTTILKQLIQSAVSAIRSDRQLRAVVYDSKNDMLPFLRAVKADETPIYVLDSRRLHAFAWDVAADCHSVTDTKQMAIALVPRRTGNKSNEYFTETSRLLTSGAMTALMDVRGTDWDLVDVVDTILDEELSDRILRQTPEGTRILDNLGSSETKANVMSSVQSFFDALSPLANMMRHHAQQGRKLSIVEWVKSPSILVLGGESSAESPQSALNRIIIERLQNVLLDGRRNPKSTTNRTFLFLDEFADLGWLEAMTVLMRLGRDRGVCTTIAFQTIGDLKNSYPGDGWRALTGHVGTKVFLRMNDYETAEWAAKTIGTRPVEPGTSVTTDIRTGNKSKTKTVGGPLSYDYIIHPSRFLSIKVAAAGYGVAGFLKSGLSQIVPRIFIPWEEVISFPEVKDAKDDCLCPAAWQRMEPNCLKNDNTPNQDASPVTKPNKDDLESYLASLKRAKHRRKDDR